MPTTLCFDLDDTLWDDGASLEACVLKVCDGLVPHLPPFDALTLARDYIRRSDEFWLSRRYDVELLPDARLQLWTEVLTDYGCDDPRVAIETRDVYTAQRQTFAVCYDETLEVVARLAEQFRLVAITNGPGEVQRHRLKVAGLDRYFAGVVAATDVELAKPDPAMFLHALKLTGASPEEAWHIGDSLGSDVAGALNAAFDAAVWLNRDGLTRAESDPKPHYEVEDLRQFAGLLERHPRLS